MITSATQKALEMVVLVSSGTFDVNAEVSALSAMHYTFRSRLVAYTNEMLHFKAYVVATIT